MPETTKTFANMEILQGADYEIIITLDSATTGKTYVMMVRKDFILQDDMNYFMIHGTYLFKFETTLFLCEK